MALCETAGDYDTARAKLHARFTMLITRFTFAWNAFELVVKTLALKRHPRGKLSSAKPALGLSSSTASRLQTTQGMYIYCSTRPTLQK